jgi:hypothetical protein
MRVERFDTDADLRIDGIELKRGQRQESRIRQLGSATADRRGARPSPVCYLGAAFHGDEVNGSRS